MEIRSGMRPMGVEGWGGGEAGKGVLHQEEQKGEKNEGDDKGLRGGASVREGDGGEGGKKGRGKEERKP